MAALLSVGVASPPQAHAQNCEYPGILVVLDRSISMYSGRIGGTRKWDIARDATASMLNAHGDAAHFGLMLYPGPSGNGAQGVEGAVGACNYNRQDAGCTPLAPRCTTGEVVVDIGANTRNAIIGQLDWPDGLSNSYTPTWQSLEAARRYPQLTLQNRRNFVILVTDGYQCCGLISENGNLSCEPENSNLIPDKVEALTDAGITTYVVGFGSSTDVRTLHRAAIRAGTTRPGCNVNVDNPGAGQECYYQASDAQSLNRFLDDIVRDISEEVCDGQDNDCDGVTDERLSRACNGACGAGVEECFNGRWGNCDAPGADPEVCNGRDDDCDNNADEGLFRDCATNCGQGVESCVNGNWGACDAPDPEPERCDGVDNNCNGVVDEGCDCRSGDERPCGQDQGACQSGTQICQNDGTWSDCQGAVGPSPEVCDGVDNDCDGIIDRLERTCSTACGNGTELCERGEWVGCDAPDLRAEVCNGEDDDCDGRFDEGVSRPCSSICGDGVEECINGQFSNCTAPNPIEEICNNGRDDNCNGQVDEMCECQNGQQQPCGSDLGTCQLGVQTCVNNQWSDCVGAIAPGTESCNGLDDDCDGITDEGDLCAAGQACGCGACVDACINNECDGDGVCTRGFCIEDNCPDGLVCEMGNCVPGEGEGNGGSGGSFGTLRDMGAGGAGGEGADNGPVTGDNGCNCDATGRTRGGELWLLALLGLGAIRRRRAR
ncbi:MAG: vWA domain-containing protein [Bradymonadia bacterium]